MKRRWMILSCGTMLLAFYLLHQGGMANAQEVRPIRDSIGFCWKGEEMASLVSYLEAHADGAPRMPGDLVAAISVHDDYLYAGRVYHTLYSSVRVKEAVIFGVTHGSVTRELGPLSGVLILDGFDRWRGPYSDVEISPLRSMIRRRLSAEDVMVSNSAHALEHSIEALIPFLQHYNRDIKITPIMVPRMPWSRMQDLSQKLASVLAEYLEANRLELGKDVLLLVSSDANHYGPDFGNAPYGTDARAHRLATENDRRIIAEHLTGDLTQPKILGLTREIWSDSSTTQPVPVWCGRYPIPLGLLTAAHLAQRRRMGTIEGSLLAYSDTFTEGVLPVKNTSLGLTAVFSYQHWCGWFTAGYYSR